MTGRSDLTLDEVRVVLGPRIAESAVFDGWSEAAVNAAAEAEAIDPAIARLAFPGGAMDMIAGWIASIDLAMEQALPAAGLAGLPVRERIRALVQFRLDALTGREEALRRALAIMAMPQNCKRTIALGWAGADRMWRLAGDDTTDFSHYTRRTILAGVYAATLTVFVDDTSEGKAESRAFLDRRIAGVIRFEKAKAQLLRPISRQAADDHFSLARFLGRLRYPAR
jgi:ubiquinone biosynthesis protein COQ9